MSNSYCISAYSQTSGYKSYSDSCCFRHLLVANSINQSIERFQKKFYSNFMGNWKFVISFDGVTKTFYFDDVLKRFSDKDPFTYIVFPCFEDIINSI